MDLLKLITAVETLDDKFYHGDVHADTIEALKALHQLRDVMSDELGDIESSLKSIRKAL